MKYAIFGGSFNPVHIGHLCLADAVLSKFDYDRIILVPAFQSPFKECASGVNDVNSENKHDVGGVSPQDRLEMLAASIAGDPRLTIDDCELKRGGVSYTIDTLRDIITRYGIDGKPGLVLGDDLVADFNKWREPDEIANLSDIIIARRLCETETAGFPYPHRTMDNEIVSVASKQIREKISRGESWRYFVPSGARYIIEEKGLYGLKSLAARDNGYPAKDYLLETIVNVENEIRTSLGFPRFMHSRNTALLSWDLCRRFGLESQKGYLAGIAHDMCKMMSDDELLRLTHRDGGSLSKLEQEKPGLLHGRAAAVLLQRRFGVTDRDVLEAIRYHTTGFRGMSALSKVVYVADKIEVSRRGVDPALMKMSQNCDLDVLFAEVLCDTVSSLKSRQLDISYGTRSLLAAMQKRNTNEKNKG